MKTSYDIIVRPVITEDSMARVPSKCYTFEVAKSATKAEIAKAVEELFKGSHRRQNQVSEGSGHRNQYGVENISGKRHPRGVHQPEQI